MATWMSPTGASTVARSRGRVRGATGVAGAAGVPAPLAAGPVGRAPPVPAAPPPPHAAHPNITTAATSRIIRIPRMYAAAAAAARRCHALPPGRLAAARVRLLVLLDEVGAADVGVELGRRDVGVAEHRLHR